MEAEPVILNVEATTGNLCPFLTVLNLEHVVKLLVGHVVVSFAMLFQVAFSGASKVTLEASEGLLSGVAANMLHYVEATADALPAKSAGVDPRGNH